MAFHIDLPNWIDPEGEWKHIDDFESKEAAIQYARETFGADAEGRIGIISASTEEDDDTDLDWKEIAQTEIRQALADAFKVELTPETRAIQLNDSWCGSYPDMLMSLVALADDIHDASQTPEEFHPHEAESWAQDAMEKFDSQLITLGWIENGTNRA